jgi:GNAT superfamily N-acetyltransferase
MAEDVPRIDANWEEEVALDDGTRVRMRLIRPDDAPLIAEGFQKLSPESRYRRFLGPKSSLTPADLEYLTNVDGENHLAIGAVVHHGFHDEGVGTARFIRLHEDPRWAEPAITVIDEFQGRGLGKALLKRLIAAAKQRGVVGFRSEVLAGNDRIRGLISSVQPGARITRQETVLSIEIPFD